MLLTVIVPDTRQGMKKMLARELQGLDAEVIYMTWRHGLKKAKGEFVCLLEKGSGISRGAIRENLDVFLRNPSYRKLAMVSCLADLPRMTENIAFTYNESGLALMLDIPSRSVYASRIGLIPGAIVRKSSLLKSDTSWMGNPFRYSTETSMDFWSRGLRVQTNPDTVYQAPEEIVKYKKARPVKMRPAAYEVWVKEMIS